MYWLMDVSLLDVHTFSTCNDILRPLTPKQKGKCSSEMEAARNSLSAQALWRTLMPAISPQSTIKQSDLWEILALWPC